MITAPTILEGSIITSVHRAPESSEVTQDSSPPAHTLQQNAPTVSALDCRVAVADLVSLLIQTHHLLRAHYQSAGENPEALSVEQKSDHSPVTQADLAAHHLIVGQLATLTPGIPVLSEESPDTHHSRHWQEYWLLDPLDGTREFINRTGEFSVNLALIQHHRVVFGMIGLPVQKAIYLSADDGCYRFDQTGWQRLPHAGEESQRKEKKDTRDADTPPARRHATPFSVALSRRGKSQRGPIYQQFLEELDSPGGLALIEAGSAYKFCLMVEGKVDLYPRFHPTSEWDTAAGQALLEASGGALVDRQGRDFRYNCRETFLNNTFVAVRNRQWLSAILGQACFKVDE